MNLLRREIKFQISESLVSEICKYIEMYCELDKYSKLESDNFYTLNTLYLDNEQHSLINNKRNNIANRFSMRIRSYGEQPTFPAFLEMKQKKVDLIHKRRIKISNNDTLNFVAQNCSNLTENKDLNQESFQPILFQMINLNLKPQLMTQYRRKAYFGVNDTYARVTFDKNLKCYKEDQFNIFPSKFSFSNYDNEEVYISPNSHIILELKCEMKIPFWMLNLIKYFELKNNSFSKFDSSFTHQENLISGYL